MFPLEVLATYTLACLLLVISPGPDNMLAIGRGLSQGRLAATVSGLSSGMGILFQRASGDIWADSFNSNVRASLLCGQDYWCGLSHLVRR